MHRADGGGAADCRCPRLGCCHREAAPAGDHRHRRHLLGGAWRSALAFWNAHYDERGFASKHTYHVASVTPATMINATVGHLHLAFFPIDNIDLICVPPLGNSAPFNGRE